MFFLLLFFVFQTLPTTTQKLSNPSFLLLSLSCWWPLPSLWKTSSFCSSGDDKQKIKYHPCCFAWDTLCKNGGICLLCYCYLFLSTTGKWGLSIIVSSNSMSVICEEPVCFCQPVAALHSVHLSAFDSKTRECVSWVLLMMSSVWCFAENVPKLQRHSRTSKAQVFLYVLTFVMPAA